MAYKARVNLVVTGAAVFFFGGRGAVALCGGAVAGDDYLISDASATAWQVQEDTLFDDAPQRGGTSTSSNIYITARSNGIISTPDGRTWTREDSNLFTAPDTPVFVAGDGGTTFAATLSSSTVDTTARVYYSTDFSTWNNDLVDATTSPVSALTYVNSIWFVAGADNSGAAGGRFLAYTATLGTSWTKLESSDMGNPTNVWGSNISALERRTNPINFGGGNYATMGGNNSTPSQNVHYSSDLSSWTVTDFGDSYDQAGGAGTITNLQYLESLGRWVGVAKGTSGELRYTYSDDDFSSYTSGNAGIVFGGSGGYRMPLAQASGRLYCCFPDGSNNQIIASSLDGTNWTTVEVDTGDRPAPGGSAGPSTFREVVGF